MIKQQDVRSEVGIIHGYLMNGSVNASMVETT